MSDNALPDRIAFELLRHLSNDGRLSNKQLAAALGLAPSTTHERLKQLRAQGMFAGTHAEVDLKKLGYVIEALLHIALRGQIPETVQLFLNQLKTRVEVRQFLVVTGRFDLVVQIAVRDTDHLRKLEYELAACPLVERIETAVVFESWRQHSLPTPVWLDSK